MNDLFTKFTKRHKASSSYGQLQHNTKSSSSYGQLQHNTKKSTNNSPNLIAKLAMVGAGGAAVLGAGKAIEYLSSGNKHVPSDLYKTINTDNDYSENSNLSTQEMTDYYGKKNGSQLTSDVISAKYKENGPINIYNEDEKLPDFDRAMRKYQEQAQKTSDYVENNGTRHGGFLGLFGGDKYLTYEKLLSEGYSSDEIKTIMSYDSGSNNGDNDGKISKSEAVNASILGNIEFKNRPLSNDTQNVFSLLDDGDNILKAEELEKFKQLGYDPSENFEKHKTTINGETGIIKGDAEKFMQEIDYQKINDYINNLPPNIKEDFLKATDLNHDGEINTTADLYAALKYNENMEKIINEYKLNQIRANNIDAINVQVDSPDGYKRTKLIDLYDANVADNCQFKYDEAKRQFVVKTGIKEDDVQYLNDTTSDIVKNHKEFINLGEIQVKSNVRSENNVIKTEVNGLVELDDGLKEVIRQEYGNISKESIAKFQDKWQCSDMDDVANLGALKNNEICVSSLFSGEQKITTDKIQNYTVIGTDKSGIEANLLDFLSDGRLDGYIDKNIFINPIKINDQEIAMDSNKDGIVSSDERGAFFNTAKDLLGPEGLKNILDVNTMKDDIIKGDSRQFQSSNNGKAQHDLDNDKDQQQSTDGGFFSWFGF